MIVFHMEREELISLRNKMEDHLVKELLPFWTKRIVDGINGGFITHFDKNGNDTGDDEKSLIAQTRCIYTLASAHRAGYGDGELAVMAKHGVDFLTEKMWDSEYEGFFWMADRKGNIKADNKIIYGHSFAIYSLSEYTLATGDPRGKQYATRVFDLLQKYCTDTLYGGYWEMFHRNWALSGPGSQGGDRKTLDVHMHLMEAFTTLFECTGLELHRRKLLEVIDILTIRFLHPEYKTGIPQFFDDWEMAPQIKFDIIWGWDRFSGEGKKINITDNTSYGHNAELAWLLLHALEILDESHSRYDPVLRKIYDHVINNGIDTIYGGVYVEGPHSGGVSDMEKEFWQQAEVMTALLDALLIFKKESYWEAFRNVVDFVFSKVINKGVGEWYPLLTREGKPIWDHMGHSWKINYHTVRSMIQSIERLDKIISIL
jgi:mannose/cellobiose epimerase-like protein (N-acyl-D-glucosamine 2-epimerase family)